MCAVPLDLVDLHLIDCGIGIVHDIVNGSGERIDILTVDGRHKGPIELLDEDPS